VRLLDGQKYDERFGRLRPEESIMSDNDCHPNYSCSCFAGLCRPSQKPSIEYRHYFHTQPLMAATNAISGISPRRLLGARGASGDGVLATVLGTTAVGVCHGKYRRRISHKPNRMLSMFQT